MATEVRFNAIKVGDEYVHYRCELKLGEDDQVEELAVDVITTHYEDSMLIPTKVLLEVVMKLVPKIVEWARREK